MIQKLIPSAMALSLFATAHAKAAEEVAPATPAPAKEATPTPAPAGEKPAPAAIPKPIDPAVLKADSSYGFGFQAGTGFLQQFGQYGLVASDVEQEDFTKGFLAALKGDKPEIPSERLQAAMAGLGNMLQAREKEIATKNLADGKKFIEENGKKKDVVTTKSGLQYEVLTKGGSEKYVAPKDGKEDNKQFLVNYKGTKIDGKEFDASPAGEPVAMTLMVIPGFKEALTTMPIGAKWKLTIPSELAYGEKRGGANIPPNSVLIFDLELVKIEDAPAPQGMPGMPGMQMPGGE